jgi:hypothetical protein
MCESRINGNKRDSPVLVLVLLVDAAHQGGSRRQYLIDKDEDSLLGRQLDALADHIDELADGEICGNQVLLLVDSSDVRLLDLLADDLWAEQTRLATRLETSRRSGGRRHLHWRGLVAAGGEGELAEMAGIDKPR